MAVSSFAENFITLTSKIPPLITSLYTCFESYSISYGTRCISPRVLGLEYFLPSSKIELLFAIIAYRWSVLRPLLEIAPPFL